MNISNTSKLKWLVLFGSVVLLSAIILYVFPKLGSEQILPIPYSQLPPSATLNQARVSICAEMSGSYFDTICQHQFDTIAKEDFETIYKLLSLLVEIKDDKGISSYDRLLLGHAIFAALPTKDSPLTIAESKISSFIEIPVAYAVELNQVHMSEEDFNNMMAEDLKSLVDSLPSEDNAWAMTVMVTMYEWVNGERQPIYSEQHDELFDPYPGVLIEDKSGYEQQKLVHMNSRSSAYMYGQNISIGSDVVNTSSMIAYHFSIMSWHSKPYGTDSNLILAESGPSEKYLKSDYHFTENGHKGDDLLGWLLDITPMPSRENRTTTEDEKVSNIREVPPKGTEISSTDYDYILDTPECPYHVVEFEYGIYCYDSMDYLNSLIDSKTDLSVILFTPPTYPFVDGHWEEPEIPWCGLGYDTFINDDGSFRCEKTMK